ncbi:hypothetical protein AB0F16_39815 [Streptomyces tanashiensis]|uniref:hypothetical protein n=1 Tax=Streptomyces tanashiensis TaxID=67367 RepID=UPI0033D3D432
MKATETYGFPYPECDPPLVKDSSQIVQMQNLALAIDTEVQRAIIDADDALIHPPATRVGIAILPVVTTDNLAVPFFDTSVFAVNWGAPTALSTQGGILVQKGGWYLAGCHALVSSATAAVLPMVRLTVNGVPASSWSAPAGNYGVANSRLAALSAVPLLVQAEDVIRMEIKHLAAGAPSWDFRPHLWCVRMLEDS